MNVPKTKAAVNPTPKDGEYWWMRLRVDTPPLIGQVSICGSLRYIYPCGDEEGWKLDNAVVLLYRVPRFSPLRTRL
jgi:hypothetical protein